MRPARAAYLTARRELRERFRSRAFQVSTLIQVVAVVAVVIVASALSGGGPTKATVAFTGAGAEASARAAQQLQARVDLELELRGEPSPAAAAGAVRDERADAAVTPGRVLVGEDAPDALGPLLAQTASAHRLDSGLRRAGLGPAEASRITASATVPTTEVEGDSDDSAQAIAYLGALLLYLAIVFCGYAVSSGVVEEKSTRVVELIMSAIKPRELLAGKVVGIGLIGLGQLLAIVLAGLVTALLTGSVELPSATGGILALALVYFVLGFTFYGCAFAAAGSIVSRQEDSSSTTAPLLILLVAGYIASISVIDSPDSTAAVVLSMIPPLAPMIVPTRAASGELPAGELAASLALMVLACGALIWIAGRIYERAVLRMGAPLRFREALGLLRGG